jgi:hypothetical protein
MQPVTGIEGAPPGTTGTAASSITTWPCPTPGWREEPDAIVLYPHFNEHIVPGWLDKAMPWRRCARGPNRGWLDNVLIVAPTPAFLATLPRKKLPDRKDFSHYGIDHDERIRNWQQAIGQGQRLRDEFAAFAARPELARVLPI